MMSRIRTYWHHARPNRIGLGRMAHIALHPDGTPSRSWQPFAAVQLIGGRRWTLSLIRLSDITGYPRGRGPVDRDLIEEALDLLRGEERDEDAAAAILANALEG